MDSIINYEQFNICINNIFSEYKNKLGILEDGIWENNKGNIETYKWILPKEMKYKNILPSNYEQQIVEKIKKQADKNEKFLDKNFHNLKSSQALCFNLFYPLTFKENYSYIDETIVIDKYTYPYFELLNKINKTQFDFYIGKGYEIKKKVYNGYSFEIKYSEKNFGTNTSCDKIEYRYNNIYKSLIEKFSKVKKIDLDTFYNNYQLFRNIFHSIDGITYFIIPKFRNDLNTIIKKIVEEYCTEEQSARIKVQYMENIVAQILNNITEITHHYELFYNKYIKAFKNIRVE
jgi:hypothetical protein